MQNRDIKIDRHARRVLRIRISLPPLKMYCFFYNASLLQNIFSAPSQIETDLKGDSEKGGHRPSNQTLEPTLLHSPHSPLELVCFFPNDLSPTEKAKPNKSYERGYHNFSTISPSSHISTERTRRRVCIKILAVIDAIEIFFDKKGSPITYGRDLEQLSLS